MNSSNDDRNALADDVLARSISAIRAEDDVEGPSPEVYRRVLDALSRLAPEPRSDVNFFQRTLHMVRVHKWAATLTLGAGGMIAWALLLILSPWSGVSYGAVAEQIRSAQTIQFRMTAVVNGQQMPGGASTVFMKEPGHVRMETPLGTMISDVPAGKMLTIEPPTWTAHLVSFNAAAPANTNAGPFDSIDGFKRLADAKGKPIADRMIGDVNAKGFELELGPQHIRMWVDPKTRLPLRIESSAEWGGQQVKVTLTDLVFGHPLDDAMFSLTPPKGFALTTSTLNLPAQSETCETVASVLGAYAKRVDGHFPKSLTDWGDLAVVMSKDSKDGTLDPDAQQAMVNLGSLVPTLTEGKKGTDYDYTPGDVRLGDASKIVFWSRGKHGHPYRAVFGDLSVKDVTSEQVTPH